MRNRLFRLLFVIEFLLALQVAIAFWSHVGGQYHLDLMFWPWKFGLSLLAAALVVAITAGKHVRAAAALLILTIGLAGLVTYYYHLNEPSDEDEPADQQTKLTRGPLQPSLPDAAGLLAAHHRLPDFAAERLLELRHI